MANDTEEVVRRLLARVHSAIDAGDVQYAYLTRHTGPHPSDDYLRELAQVKRLLERWTADGAFRERLEREPDEAVASLGLDLDPRLLKYLWHEETAVATPAEEVSGAALRYRAFILEKITHRNRLRANDPTMDRRFATWRTRQMRRVDTQLPPLTAGSIVHAPFCVELSQGCSVGCWFCGIAAPKLSDLFLWSDENAALFRGVVESLRPIFGEATGRGFCYWATDPMDNPDYERFMSLFHDLTGSFPQTTTALALKDVARTRRLLALSRARGGMLDRFSLLTLAQLERVHREFTPEELLHVELVTQNKEGHQRKAAAGRALEGRAPRRAGDAPWVGDQVAAGTIACVTGFLISMVGRTVKLISPCEACERWPLGYVVFDEAPFRDVTEFREQVARMVDEHMRPSLADAEVVSFHDHLRYLPFEDGFRLAGRHRSIDFTDSPVLASVGRAVAQGTLGVDEVLDAEAEHDPAEVLFALHTLLDHGVLSRGWAPAAAELAS